MLIPERPLATAAQLRIGAACFSAARRKVYHSPLDVPQSSSVCRKTVTCLTIGVASQIRDKSDIPPTSVAGQEARLEASSGCGANVGAPLWSIGLATSVANPTSPRGPPSRASSAAARAS